MEKVSTPGNSLMIWVRSLYLFYTVNKVAPKQKLVNEMNIKLKNANDQLNKKQYELSQVNLNIKRLKKTM